MEPYEMKIAVGSSFNESNLVRYEPLTIDLTEKQIKKLKERRIVVIQRNKQRIKVSLQ